MHAPKNIRVNFYHFEMREETFLNLLLWCSQIVSRRLYFDAPILMFDKVFANTLNPEWFNPQFLDRDYCFDCGIYSVSHLCAWAHDLVIKCVCEFESVRLIAIADSNSLV